ncbi:MAG: FMN-dependent NADH-azoreductase 1 [Holosporales bacterium]
MTKVLQINSSINKENSNSKKLTNKIIDFLHAQDNTITTHFLDLVENPVQHLVADDFKDLAQNTYLESFLNNDVIVIGVPMYNFGIPSQLKAWLDRLSIAGKTFRYTEKGPEGLVKGKKIIIASARGGFYSQDDIAKACDHQEAYLVTFFNFLGITDIEIVRLEGLGMGEDSVKAAFSKAEDQINCLKVCGS